MVTLTGTFTRLDGSPASGTVRVTPSRSPIMDPDGKIVISGPQTFPLDADGTLSVPIPASNDPDLGPPFTYSIDVNLTHASWKISKVWIPHGSTAVDLSEIADYTPVPGVATRVVTIPADGTDGQVLVWDGAGFSWDDPPKGDKGDQGNPGTSDIVVDTSVGTRVYANGVMVHGDTGWRTLTSWDTTGTVTGQALPPGIEPLPGSAGAYRVRRDGGTIYATLKAFRVSATGGLPIPTGFRADSQQIQLTKISNTASIRALISSTIFVASEGAYPVDSSGSYAAVMSWTTADPWPATLPGTP